MAHSFENFEDPSVDTLPEQEASEAISSPYDQAVLDKVSLESEVLNLQKQIEETPHLDNEDKLIELQNKLAVAERDLEEAMESMVIEERKMQARNRARHEETIAARKKEEMDVKHEEALGMHAEFEKDQDLRAAARHDEASEMNAQFDVEKAYQENRESAERSLAFYARDPERIERQRKFVESLMALTPEEVKVKQEEYQVQLKDFEAQGVPFMNPEVQEIFEAWKETQKLPERIATESATLANMEKFFPSRDHDAKKFVEQYFGKNGAEHQAAVELYSLEVKKANDIESLVHIIERWGAIPEGNKFVTNTKFRQDLEAIVKLSSEDEKVAELEKVTKNDEVCEKLLELYRKERDEALTEITEDTPKKQEEAPKKPSFAMRQPNLPPVRPEPVYPPELISLITEEQELRDLSEIVSSTRFKNFPASLYMSKKGRAALKLLRRMDALMDTKHNRSAAVPIAVALRLRAVMEDRARMEEKLGIDAQDRLKPGNKVVRSSAGPMVMPLGNRRPARPNWFARTFLGR